MENRNQTIDEVLKTGKLYVEKRKIEIQLQDELEEEKQQDLNDCREKFIGELKEFQSGIEKRYPSMLSTSMEPIPTLPQGFTKEYAKKAVKAITLGVICAVGTVVSLLLGMIPILAILMFVSVALFITWVVVCAPKIDDLLDWQKKDEEYEKNFTQWSNSLMDNLSKKSYEDYLAQTAEYDQSYLKMVALCEEERNRRMPEYEEKKASIEKQYQAKREELLQEKKKIVEELQSIGLVPEYAYPYVHLIARYLISEEANNLTHAIMLASDEHERMVKQARQDVEERMLRSQQEYETRRHNEAMEKAAQEQARAEKARADEARKQTYLAEEQARKAKADASQRCFSCAKWKTCSMRHNAPLNCSGFTPR